MPPKKTPKKPANLHQGADYLVIVESPSKTSKIEQYLGYGYRVIASKGHLTKIDGLKSINLKGDYSIQFSFIDAKKSHIEEMRRIISDYATDHVIIATDNDREGEAIGYHLCQIFGLPIESTPRILFNEITPSALKYAIEHPTVLNMNLIRSQHARQILDLVIGFKISPILWKYVYSSKSNALSAGRCQTPALRLVYDNYLERLSKNGVGEQSYKTVGHFFPPHNLSCELNHAFVNKDDVRAFLNASKTHLHTFTIGDKEQTFKKPPTPLNTSRMLQVASNLLHITPKITMQLAQKLYQEGHITYMRTESKKYSQEFLDKAEKYIMALRYDDAGPDGRRYLGNFGDLSSEGLALPHEAIRVTDLTTTELSSSDTKLNSLYRFIWKNTVESCMSTAHYDVYKISVLGPQDHIYKHTLEYPTFLGWKRIEETTDKTMVGIQNQQLGVLSYLQSLKGAGATYTYLESSVVVHGKHSHFTESGLIQKLEDLGIGRPSTYSMFIETIQERGYVVKRDVEGERCACTDFILRATDGKLQETVVEKTFGGERSKLVIQPLGVLCIEFLMKHFATLFDYSYTQHLEEELDRIHGETLDGPWYRICEQTVTDITTMIKSINKIHKQVYPLDKAHDVVFQAFGPCIRRHGCENAQGVINEDDVEYIPIQRSIQLDMDKLKGGGYTLEELILYKQSYLGKHQDLGVFLRTGPYGYFIEHGDTKKSLGKLDDANMNAEFFKTFNLERAVAIINGEVSDSTEGASQSTKSAAGILRTLNEDMSVRRGQYGNYIYYKTATMSKPQFINTRSFKGGNVLSCNAEELIQWALETKDAAPKRGGHAWRGRGRGK